MQMVQQAEAGFVTIPAAKFMHGCLVSGAAGTSPTTKKLRANGYTSQDMEASWTIGGRVRYLDQPFSGEAGAGFARLSTPKEIRQYQQPMSEKFLKIRIIQMVRFWKLLRKLRQRANRKLDNSVRNIKIKRTSQAAFASKSLVRKTFHIFVFYACTINYTQTALSSCR